MMRKLNEEGRRPSGTALTAVTLRDVISLAMQWESGAS